MQITPAILPHDVHIVPMGKIWAIKQEHLPSYTSIFQTQTEAISSGMMLARQSAAMLVIHGRDGRFRDVRNYG